MNVFSWRLWFSWRFWKWRNWCDLEDLVFIWGTWSVKTFVFIVFIFSFLSHRKHRTVKGGRGNTKEIDFHVMLISQSDTYLIHSSEAIGNLISAQLISSVMSDYGFHKPLRGSNSGVHAEISTYPACLLAILLSLARRAWRDKETQ